MKNSGDSVLDPQPSGDGEADLIKRFLEGNDFTHEYHVVPAIVLKRRATFEARRAAWQ